MFVAPLPLEMFCCSADIVAMNLLSPLEKYNGLPESVPPAQTCKAYRDKKYLAVLKIKLSAERDSVTLFSMCALKMV